MRLFGMYIIRFILASIATGKNEIKMGNLDSKPQSGKTYLSLTIFLIS